MRSHSSSAGPADAIHSKVLRTACACSFAHTHAHTGLVGVEWPSKEDTSRELVRVLMMRVAYGHALACHYADDRAYHYQAWLWIDTHLDMLVAVASKGGSPTDEALYPLLDACYPLPHRVLCAEELPDLGRYLVHVDFIMDSGKGKTQHPTLANELIHLLCKLMNQICHIRHLGDTILECALRLSTSHSCPRHTLSNTWEISGLCRARYPITGSVQLEADGERTVRQAPLFSLQ